MALAAVTVLSVEAASAPPSASATTREEAQRALAAERGTWNTYGTDEKLDNENIITDWKPRSGLSHAVWEEQAARTRPPATQFSPAWRTQYAVNSARNTHRPDRCRISDGGSHNSCRSAVEHARYTTQGQLFCPPHTPITAQLLSAAWDLRHSQTRLEGAKLPKNYRKMAAAGGAGSAFPEPTTVARAPPPPLALPPRLLLGPGTTRAQPPQSWRGPSDDSTICCMQDPRTRTRACTPRWRSRRWATSTPRSSP